MDSHDNIFVVNGFLFLRIMVVVVKFDSLVGMLYLEDVTLIVNNLRVYNN